MSVGRAVSVLGLGVVLSAACSDSSSGSAQVDASTSAPPVLVDAWRPDDASPATVDATSATSFDHDAAGDALGPGAARDDLAWKLVWSDEFAGPEGDPLDRAKWRFDLGGGGWGNAELQNYTDRTTNAALDGAGHLAITARREALAGSAFTSARLLTQGIGSWQYGRFEARVQLPAGQGLWPAFWLLGDDLAQVGWPGCGEIDIMENIGREPAIVHATLHGPSYSAAAGPTSAYTAPSGRLADAFHVFAVEWEAGAIRWYLDEQAYASKTAADIPRGARWVFDHPFFMILDLAVGGAWPGNPDATTVFPQRMLVDYVRVYQR